MDARQAYAAAKPGRNVIGWKLAEADRERLLQRFPLAYGNVVAHHVTLRPRVDKRSAFPQERSGEVVGIADDGEGVQALAVKIAGTTQRPDGGTYHITWSLGDGRRAKESNEVIAAKGWTAIDEPIAISLEPGVVG